MKDYRNVFKEMRYHFRTGIKTFWYANEGHTKDIRTYIY